MLGSRRMFGSHKIWARGASKVFRQEKAKKQVLCAKEALVMAVKESKHRKVISYHKASHHTDAALILLNVSAVAIHPSKLFHLNQKTPIIIYPTHKDQDHQLLNVHSWTQPQLSLKWNRAPFTMTTYTWMKGQYIASRLERTLWLRDILHSASPHSRCLFHGRLQATPAELHQTSRLVQFRFIAQALYSRKIQPSLLSSLHPQKLPCVELFMKMTTAKGHPRQ